MSSVSRCTDRQAWLARPQLQRSRTKNAAVVFQISPSQIPRIQRLQSTHPPDAGCRQDCGRDRDWASFVTLNIACAAEFVDQRKSTPKSPNRIISVSHIFCLGLEWHALIPTQVLTCAVTYHESKPSFWGEFDQWASQSFPHAGLAWCGAAWVDMTALGWD